MLRAVAILVAALLSPALFVAGYLLLAHAVNWHVGPTGDGIVLVGGVIAGVAPVLLARGPLWVRILISALYAYPCVMLVTFCSLALSCSMFQDCLS
jgi:hypothetical protein